MKDEPKKQSYFLVYYILQDGQTDFKKVAIEFQSLGEMIRAAYADIKLEKNFKIEITIDHLVVATVN